MPINVTGFKLRTKAHTTLFGFTTIRPSGPEGPVLRMIGHSRQLFGTNQDQPSVIFADEAIHIESVFRLSENPLGRPLHPFIHRIHRLIFPVPLRATVEALSDNDTWQVIASMDQSRMDSEQDINLKAKVYLPPGTIAFRVHVQEGAFNPTRFFSGEYAVRVRPTPKIMTFMSMGGSSIIGTGSSASSSDFSSSSSSSSGSSSNGGISIDASQCTVDPTLIPELMLPENVQCNDLCAGCMNFIEHLGVRLLDEEGLANSLESLRYKEQASLPDFCDRRTNPDGVTNRVILGKWENSEHEPFRPPAIKTFESILDELDQEGGGHLLIVGQSHGGAKLAATVNDKWRWGNRIRVPLFAAWDVTHFGGGVTSLGSRPERVINFYQTVNPLWFQNGASIVEADLEHDLSGCISHNAIARSIFVHQTTYDALRTAIATIRTDAREA